MAVLLAAATAVMLAASATVTGLLLARGTSRHRELAVLAALGARRARLAGQLLIERLLLSAAGGLLGIMVARGGTDFLARFIPEAQASVDLSPDYRVLAFSLFLVATVGLLCGLIPAFRLSRIDLATALKNQGGTLAGGSGGGLNKALVVAQITLSCVLLAVAGHEKAIYRQISSELLAILRPPYGAAFKKQMAARLKP
jgi:predicted lysophospholipase L1 biosynthesis ABC-type transport system permease subunit